MASQLSLILTQDIVIPTFVHADVYEGFLPNVALFEHTSLDKLIANKDIFVLYRFQSVATFVLSI